jgi:hypothetical protein
MKWVTRERPKIDRIACPWLIARFIDRDPDAGARHGRLRRALQLCSACQDEADRWPPAA